MPARDQFHYVLRTALEKEEWTITADPLYLEFGGLDLYIDFNTWELSHERESSEQFVRYGETEAQLHCWAIMPSIQADRSQDEVI